MRLRITFAKTEAMRFTGHLDLHRAWERTFRRAGLPLAYTQGFSPHPRLNLASALPLGCTGEAELIDAWLEVDLDVVEVLARLQEAAPPGIKVEAAEAVDERLAALQSMLRANIYTITLVEPLAGLNDCLNGLLGAASLPRERRGKAYDLRPLILDLSALPDDDQGRPRFQAVMMAQEGATGRPEEVLEALGVGAAGGRSHRTGIVLEE